MGHARGCNPSIRPPGARGWIEGGSERAMSSAVKRSTVMVLLGLLALGATYWGWGYLLPTLNGQRPRFTGSFRSVLDVPCPVLQDQIRGFLPPSVSGTRRGQ